MSPDSLSLIAACSGTFLTEAWCCPGRPGNLIYGVRAQPAALLCLVGRSMLLWVQTD